MALTEYVRKRNFKNTPEPKGQSGRQKSLTHPLMFVIHEHHASHLHYDFRLEWNGTLKSWAVPKGPSLDPHIKRLAVQVEDHPLAYGHFEGMIPEKQYGAGQVIIWDTGTWKPIGNATTGLKNGRLEFELLGGKLKGQWMLVRTRGKSSSKAQWLLMKKSDAYAVKGNVADVMGEEPHRAAPNFVSPELALLVDEPPTGKEWVHEIKFDGYRIQASIQKGQVKLYTRAGNDWTDRFPFLVKELEKMKGPDASFDGEVVYLDEHGRSDFQLLQNAIKSLDQSHLFYYAFDLLSLDEKDLRSFSLVDRKKALKKLLAAVLRSKKSRIRYSEHSQKSGNDLLAAACSTHLEGLVSKRLHSAYVSGRQGDWVKSKCIHEQEFVIGGFTTGSGARVGFGALLLGVYEKGHLRYVGKVGTGFTTKSLQELKKTLLPLVQKENPFQKATDLPLKNVSWVRPELSAEIVFANWTQDGHLRVPVFHGLREDKPVREIHREIPNNSKKTDTDEDIHITHADKILYAKEKLTKKDIANYYTKISTSIMPYIKGRPLTLVRCPEGTKKVCFYQKHLDKDAPAFIESIEIEEKNKSASYMTIEDSRGLLSLVQLGAFEIHCWNSTRGHVENPDQIVMDFDPGPQVSWKTVKEAAFALKEILESLKLPHFVKLSGGKGLHVHIPIQPLYSWDQVKAFSEALALQLQKSNPDLFLTKMSKALREKKIFIDYLRNSRGATAVAPYSLRAREYSSVAMPVSWAELKKIENSAAFSLPEALKYLKKRKLDPWKDYFKKPGKLPMKASTK